RAIELATKACEATDYKDGRALCSLAVVYAGTGDSKEATKWFHKSLEQPVEDSEVQYFRALVLSTSGDSADYRSACNAIVKQFVKSTRSQDLHWLAWTCSLCPNATDDMSVPVKIAQDLVSKAPDNYQYVNTLGALLYRTENYQEAAKHLSDLIAKVGTDSPIKSSAVYPLFFLAMTKWKLGAMDEANRILLEAQTGMDQEMKAAPPWNRRATLELLRREAELLILPREPSDKQAKA